MALKADHFVTSFGQFVSCKNKGETFDGRAATVFGLTQAVGLKRKPQLFGGPALKKLQEKPCQPSDSVLIKLCLSVSGETQR